MIVTVQKAAEIIKDGGIVAIPTETVYGLAADAFNVVAVKKTFDAKGRPADNPLIVHISHPDHLELLTEHIGQTAEILVKNFWPGPLTIVIHKKSSVPDIVTGGLDSVAIRMPNHPDTLQLISQTGPLTAPSANRSGLPSATRPDHVENDFGKTFPILDGARPSLGIESTVVDIRTKPLTILRPGAVTAKMIESVTGLKVKSAEKNSQIHRHSPGTRYTHYKPAASVKVIHEKPDKFDSNSTYIFHSDKMPLSQANVYNYMGNFDRMAQDLYDYFRQADHSGHSQIFIEKLPDSKKSSIISALKDRIERASSD